MIQDLKPYVDYQDSGSLPLGGVPAHWQIRSMGSLTSPRSERNRADLPLLSVVREKGVILRSRGGDDDNHNFIPDDLSNYKAVRKGDLVINKMKAWQGSLGIAPQDGIVSPAYYVFDFIHPESRYAHLLLRSKPYVALFGQESDGVRVGQWDLSIHGMKRIPVLVPPLDECAAIVRFLDYMDRSIRRAVRAKRKLIALLDEQKQVIIHQAVTRGMDPNVRLKSSGVEWLGDVPEHWKVSKIKHVVIPRAGIQMGPFGASLTQLETHDTGFKLFGQENTISGDFKKGTRWLSEHLFHELKRYEICPGDLVLTRKGSIGKCRMVPVNSPVGIADSDTIRVRVSKDLVSSEFLEMLLHYAPYIQFQFQSVQRGAILGGLNTATIAGLRIALPPRVEQDYLLRELHDRMGDLDRSVTAIEREISLILELRTRLISDVVTGKLDVREVAAQVPTEEFVEEAIDDGEVNPGDEETSEEAETEEVEA